jgi:hypothetical protein
VDERRSRQALPNRSPVRAPLAALVIALVVVSAAGSASARPTADASAVHFRCCWDASIAADVSLHVEYPCAQPGKSCADPTAARYPFGSHLFDTEWRGEEIFRYREANGVPGISAAPDLAGGARFWLYVKDHGLWDFSVDDGAQCLRVTTTDPAVGTTKPHWLAANSFIHFVASGRFIRIAINASGFRGVFSKCGLGVSYHGASADRAAWDGLNEPWQWTVKGPTRDQWRHARSLLRTVRRTLPANTLHTGPGGGAQHYMRLRIDSLVVSLRYVAPSRLAAEAKRFKREYPTNSKGVRLVEDDECRPC